MTTTIIKKTTGSLTLQIVIPFHRSMLEAENEICDVLNEAGSLASGNFLKRFDADGSRLSLRKQATQSTGQNSSGLNLFQKSATSHEICPTPVTKLAFGFGSYRGGM